MRKLLSLLMLLCLFGCHKEDDMTPAELLMSHPWYPYQTEYKTVDSSFSYPGNDPNVKPTITVTNSDSTALASECGQQTVYSFENNAVLHVTNTCPNLPSDVTTTWQLSQTNQMSMYLAGYTFLGNTNYFVTTGLVTNLTTHSFVFSTLSTSFYSYSSQQQSTVSHIYYTQMVTFKSR